MHWNEQLSPRPRCQDVSGASPHIHFPTRRGPRSLLKHTLEYFTYFSPLSLTLKKILSIQYFLMKGSSLPTHSAPSASSPIQSTPFLSFVRVDLAQWQRECTTVESHKMAVLPNNYCKNCRPTFEERDTYPVKAH